MAEKVSWAYAQEGVQLTRAPAALWLAIMAIPVCPPLILTELKTSDRLPHSAGVQPSKKPPPKAGDGLSNKDRHTSGSSAQPCPKQTAFCVQRYSLGGLSAAAQEWLARRSNTQAHACDDGGGGSSLPLEPGAAAPELASARSAVYSKPTDGGVEAAEPGAQLQHGHGPCSRRSSGMLEDSSYLPEESWVAAAGSGDTGRLSPCTELQPCPIAVEQDISGVPTGSAGSTKEVLRDAVEEQQRRCWDLLGEARFAELHQLLVAGAGDGRQCETATRLSLGQLGVELFARAGAGGAEGVHALFRLLWLEGRVEDGVDGSAVC